MRASATALVAVYVLVFAGSLAAGDLSIGGGSESATPPPTPIATVARRVEAIRGLRFTTLPKPVRVSPATARREATADLRRPDSARALAEEGALDTLLGLLPPGTDLRAVSAGLFGAAVAGYYDPRDGRLRVVASALTRDRILGETTIAHELTHALDDQAIGLDTGRLDRGDDGSLAYEGLVEGTATDVMTDYAARWFRPEEALGSALANAFGPTGTEHLPPYVTAGLLFPYLTRAALRRRAAPAGRWRLHARRPRRALPAAALDGAAHAPQKWISVEAPDRVRLPGLRTAVGAGSRRVAAGVLGEWRTAQLLGLSGSPHA